MEFDSVMAKRSSVRSFKSKRVSWKDILEAIDSALQGPFAGNQTNLQFIIVEDPKKIEKIASNCQQTWINESNILIVVCSNDTHLENQYGERGRVYSRQQAGAAIQTLLLKLVDLGLAGCWVGAYSDEQLKQMLEIPQQIQIEAIIPIGYDNSPKAGKKKKSLENAIYWEMWKKENRTLPIFKEVVDVRATRSPNKL